MTNIVKYDFERIPESLKGYALNRVGKKAIKDLTEHEVKNACNSIIAVSFAEIGQFKVDTPMLQFQSETLFKELRGRYKDLTLDELKEAFKMGIRNEFGQYFGLCAKTYNLFIKSYYERPERAEAMKQVLRMIDKPESKHYTEEQKEMLVKQGCLQAFNEYYESKKLPFVIAPIYDYLWQNRGLIKWTEEERNDIWQTALKAYEGELRKRRDEGEINSFQMKQILANLNGELNRTFINKVKAEGLKRFFDKLITNNQKLIL